MRTSRVGMIQIVDAPSPSSNSARSWATVSHLLGLLILSGVPLSNILGPLIVYLLKKDEDSFIAFASREAVNFQIFIAVCAIVLMAGYMTSIFTLIAHFPAVPRIHTPTLMLYPFAFFGLFIALGIFDLVSVIVAAMRTNAGEAYRYPISLRFVH
jgi:uncharacterized protein